jgi:hypothetical protein
MMLKCFHAVAVVYCLAVVAVGAEQQFRWTRRIELPVVSEVSLFAAPLDSAVYAATRDGLPDLRTQSADGKPVAMLLRKAMATKDRTIRKTWSATIGAARMQEGGALTVEWSLGDKDPAPQGLRILTPLRDFEHQVRVEASADGKTWEPIAPATVIFDYSQYVDARNDSVTIEPSERRHFRITVDDVTAEQQSQLLELERHLRGGEEIDRTERTKIDRRPFRINGVQFYRDDVETQATGEQTTSYPATDFSVSRDEKKSRTIVTFNTNRQPITQVSLVTLAENFSRGVTLSAEGPDRDGKTAWRQIAAGNLSRYRFQSLRRESLTLNLSETRSGRYQIVIEDRDNAPLEVKGVDLTGPIYEVVLLAGPKGKVDLLYGSAQATPASYDTAAIAASLSEGFLPLAATLGEAREGARAPEPEAWLVWNNPKLLVGVIVALTILLGWGLYRAGQRIDLTPNP